MSPSTESARADYVGRINRVMDYIETNLAEQLNLEQLADVAHFSPFHFHRIFRAMVGEPLGQYIQRVRVEKAASHLYSHPNRSVTDIALDCGFASSAAFAKVFKNHYGMTASEWRNGGSSKHVKYESKIEQLMSKMREEMDFFDVDIDTSDQHFTWRVTMSPEKKSDVQSAARSGKKLDMTVEVREIEDMHLAYVRHVGPYAGDAALFERLFTQVFNWAGPRGHFRPGQSKVISVYHDDPAITDEEKLRTSCGITVPEDTAVEGEIGMLKLPGGKCAVAKFEIDPDQYGDAWAAVYKGWLPQSGYQPDDRPCYENYLNDPKEHPEGKHIVEIVCPVKPL